MQKTGMCTRSHTHSCKRERNQTGQSENRAKVWF
uniref:Uncharacterized protein n=1 Tax=Rhizophora mucronata TaxID=61149 RepID=A0A2P2PCX9_RHIMU